MFAFVPGKDALLFLAKIQKKIISNFNSNCSAEFFAVPVFPLWAFFDFALPEKIISCEFLEPILKDEKFIFPVKIIFLKDGTENEINLKVVFVKILGERKSSLEFHLDSDEIKNCFPYKIRVFKTGNVLVQNNSWQLFDEKWGKCQPL
ncbi:hypothetical protein [uncultured Treponema sp.]|uniref:hypothetical protein n=1 Tax=uncultured Treponema sp. TaxID=162155 RepID=UPI0025EBEF0B|nr:hypothetical protein [uncultured Treponema sp.]